MKAPDCIYVDFETEGIEARPRYPPKPAGVALKYPGQPSRYLAWGHPCENNCTVDRAAEELRDVWRSRYFLALQNAKFDVDVAERHFGLKVPTWDRVHDTLYLLFLHDPYADSLSLKPSAERILGIAPGERDELKEWILANVPEAKRKPSTWGAYICRAPGDLVGRYACGDVDRTEALFSFLYPKVTERGMKAAYDRERRVMPIMLRNEQEGVRIDVPLIEQDVQLYDGAIATVDQWLRERLGVPDLNLNSNEEFADALEAGGIVTDFVYTAKGKRSVSKKNLTLDMFQDPQVQSAYGYRNILGTCLNTFMKNWRDAALANNGRFHPDWSQVRGEESGGARTGRFSSKILQNAPKNWKKAAAEGYRYPDFLGVPPLPNLRRYWLPDDDASMWGRRDCNQQELRILAHFEDGELMRAYNENPRHDVHAFVQQCIKAITSIEMDRDPVKIINFADIYGQGLNTLAQRLKVDVGVARQLRSAKDEALPGVAALKAEIQKVGKRGEAIRTWGGREYYVEPSGYSKKFNRIMTFEYKLLNYLIQGSGADVIKEAIIRYDEHPRKRGRLLLTVHDELDVTADKRCFADEMAVMREAIQSIELDVIMLSDGEAGTSWGTLERFKEPALDVRTTVQCRGGA